MLLAARVVQGVGAAFMTTVAIALLAHAFPAVKQRTIVIRLSACAKWCLSTLTLNGSDTELCQL